MGNIKKLISLLLAFIDELGLNLDTTRALKAFVRMVETEINNLPTPVATSYRVRLTKSLPFIGWQEGGTKGASLNKIQAIKLVREQHPDNLGLKETKDMVEDLMMYGDTITLASDYTYYGALGLQEKFWDYGVYAQIEPIEISQDS